MGPFALATSAVRGASNPFNWGSGRWPGEARTRREWVSRARPAKYPFSPRGLSHGTQALLSPARVLLLEGLDRPLRKRDAVRARAGRPRGRGVGAGAPKAMAHRQIPGPRRRGEAPRDSGVEHHHRVFD